MLNLEIKVSSLVAVQQLPEWSISPVRASPDKACKSLAGAVGVSVRRSEATDFSSATGILGQAASGSGGQKGVV